MKICLSMCKPLPVSAYLAPGSGPQGFWRYRPTKFPQDVHFLKKGNQLLFSPLTLEGINECNEREKMVHCMSDLSAHMVVAGFMHFVIDLPP